MSVSRVGSVTLYRSTMSDITATQDKLGALQKQISSGYKATDFKGINGQVEQYTQLEARMREATQFKENNEVSLSRLKTADNAMGTMVEITDAMQSLIIEQQNGTSGDSLFFEQRMQDFMQAMADQLNTNFNGRYLFGGVDTSNPPVPDVMVDPQVAGTPDAGYYQGSSDSMTFRADSQTHYEFPVRADNESFQKILAAAHQSLDAYASGNHETMKSALDLLQSGAEALVSDRATLNYMSVNLTEKNNQLDSLSLYWKEVSEKISKTDVVAATTEVSNYEAVLQATFQVYSKLSQLRLSDYL